MKFSLKKDEAVNIGEWADEMQVAAYEEPAVEDDMIGVLLETEPGDETYKKITEAILDDELKDALEAECRFEGLKLLRAEAEKRGLNKDDSEPEHMVTAGRGTQSALSSLELLDFIDLTKFQRDIDYRHFKEAEAS